MNDTLDAKINGSGTWPIRSLTRTKQADGAVYRREASVEDQVRELSGESDRTRRTRLTEENAHDRSWASAERIREETLVYFLREYARRGDDDVAWRIAEALIDRVARHVQRKIGEWRLSADAADECADDLIASLYDALFDQRASAEFWEVRFWVCLDRRLWNMLAKRQAVADIERSPGDALDGDGFDGGSGDAEDRLFAKIADGSASPEARVELTEALSHLTATERTAVYLVYVEGLPEESDDPDRPSAAKALGVTGRSVRNYLRRAREKMIRYFEAA